MTGLLSLSLVWVWLALPAVASEVHHCQEDAKERSEGLVRLHYTGSSSGEINNLFVDESVIVRPPVKSLVGNGYFDVLETKAYVYRAQHRLRFIYAQLEDDCVLMGQEILEVADPY